MLSRTILLALTLLATMAPREASGQVAPGEQSPMVSIGAGSFAMGSDSGGSWEKPVHTVRTPAFEISARPVSNGEYRQFRPSHQSPGNNADDAPVTGVSWDDARGYCEWLTAATGVPVTLPTEAWWERAVRGGLEQKKYPWGDQPAPDGSERANPYGVYAITYMLWEWAADWYKGTYYAESPADDPKGPPEGVYRVLRGGGYRNDPASATVYTRGSARPETRSERITFRVARALGAPPAQVTSAAPRPTAPAPRPPAPSSASAAAVATASAKPVVAEPKPQAPAAAPSSAETSGGPVMVTGVSFAEGDGGEVVIKLATSGPARYKSFLLKSPERVVVDVIDGAASLKPAVGTVKVDSKGVKTVRYSQFKESPAVFRAVIDLETSKTYSVESSPNEVRVRIAP